MSSVLWIVWLTASINHEAGWKQPIATIPARDEGRDLAHQLCLDIAKRLTQTADRPSAFFCVQSKQIEEKWEAPK